MFLERRGKAFSISSGFSQAPEDPNKILEISYFLNEKKDGSQVISPSLAVFPSGL